MDRFWYEPFLIHKYGTAFFFFFKWRSYLDVWSNNELRWTRGKKKTKYIPLSLFWLTIIQPQLLVFVFFLGKIIIASRLELESGIIQHWLVIKQWARKAVTLVALWRERIICRRYSVEHHVLWSRISRAVYNHKRRSWGRWQYLLAYSVDPLDLNISYMMRLNKWGPQIQICEKKKKFKN